MKKSKRFKLVWKSTLLVLVLFCFVFVGNIYSENRHSSKYGHVSGCSRGGVSHIYNENWYPSEYGPDDEIGAANHGP